MAMIKGGGVPLGDEDGQIDGDGTMADWDGSEIDAELAEKILKQESRGTWSGPMTAEELLAKWERLTSPVH